MENQDYSDDKLIPFLRNLADSIEKRELLPQQLQIIGEFFMKYQFQQQAIRDNDTSINPPSSEFHREDFIKFLILGWYIYSCILAEHNPSVPSVPSVPELDLE